MEQIEFNLIDEPWIRVGDQDNVISEVSIMDLLINAHKYKFFAGESPTQNASILRMILAITHTIFSRIDVDGSESPLTDNRVEVMKRWKSLWDSRHFPEEPVRSYMKSWHERFWLFHPERPFFQYPSASIGTPCGVKKLNGNISESGNKIRIFSYRNGQLKDHLSYSETARWLINLYFYDDSAAKPTKRKEEKERRDRYAKQPDKPSPGVAYMGHLGFISVAGNNLFETILLNMVMLQDGQWTWGQSKPVWEKELNNDEYLLIPVPDNLPELYTIPSRKLILQRNEDGRVTGYNEYKGEFVIYENLFQEQMTAWSKYEKEDNKYQPQTFELGNQAWRSFTSLIEQNPQNHKSRLPGLMTWINLLKQKKYLPKSYFIRVNAVSIQYDSKKSSIDGVFSDTIDFYSGILDELGEIWRKTIILSIKDCQKMSEALKKFASILYKASSRIPIEGKNTQLAALKERVSLEYFFKLDRPFREWLHSIDPEDEDCDLESVRYKWKKVVKKAIREQCRDLLHEYGESALKGRWYLEKEGKKQVHKHYSSAEAMNYIEWKIKTILEV